MNATNRIKELLEIRGWTINHLAQVANIPQSTLSGMFNRNNSPSLSTLESICKAFEITMSEFFAEDRSLTELTAQQRELLDKWNTLSPKHKLAILDLMEKI